LLEQWENTRSALLRRLPTLILIYCISQPILDVIGYWQMMLDLGNTLTLAVRMFLLAGSVLLGFLLSDRKRYYFITAGIIFALTALHVAANLPGGYTEPVTDLVNLVRIFLMPMTVLCFCTFLRQSGEEGFLAMKKGMMINVLIIVFVEIISVITGTDRETYRHEHIGVLGWFFWANSQSAILSMMAPIVICWSLRRWKDKLIPIALFTIAAEVTLYFFGTRLTFGAMVAAGFGIGICLLLADRQRWKQSLVIFLITAIFTGAFPVSPTARRMEAVTDITTLHMAELSEVQIETLPPDAELPTDETGEPEAADPDAPKMTSINWKKLKKHYKRYIPGVVQHFGYPRVLVKYNYITDPSVLGDWRIEKLYFCELLMEDASFMSHLFGINLLDMREYVEYGIRNEETGEWESGYINYDVENDFHGIYFLLGIVGLVFFIVFLLYFGLLGLYRVIRDFKTYFTVDMIGFAAAYVFGLLHAYFTVSVLRRNNASVYMALVLAGLWYLSRKQNNYKYKSGTLDRALNGSDGSN
jgi:hypothetical protein